MKCTNGSFSIFEAKPTSMAHGHGNLRPLIKRLKGEN